MNFHNRAGTLFARLTMPSFDGQDRPEDYEKARGKFIIDNELMKILPKSSVVLHPLPRVDEVRQFPGKTAS